MKTKLYWVTTSLVAVAFTMGGVVDTLQLPEAVKVITHLGYPPYFTSMIGVWKLLASSLRARTEPRASTAISA